ncbi:ion transporter [Candidatus Woesearchaeota archaeon]|nr:ion transporter [Candidatus Woesearchaeota archaeon]
MAKKVSHKKITSKSTVKLSAEDKIDLAIHKKVQKYLHLHLDNYGSKHGRRIEGALFILNFLAIVLFVIETHNISDATRTLLHNIELFVVGIFVLEYAARMWVAENRTKHFFNIYSIIDLLVILPVALNFLNLSFLRIFRILRLFRILRILRFQRIFKSKDTMFGNLSDTKLVVIRIVLTIFTIVFASSGFLWSIENKINPGEFGSIWNAMYFAIVTMSTVGYGDITPISAWGRLVTILMIIAGIALIPWQLGKLLKIMIAAAGKTQTNCKKCGLIEHDLDAKYCKQCGKPMKIKTQSNTED